MDQVQYTNPAEHSYLFQKKYVFLKNNLLMHDSYWLPRVQKILGNVVPIIGSLTILAFDDEYCNVIVAIYSLKGWLNLSTVTNVYASRSSVRDIKPIIEYMLESIKSMQPDPKVATLASFKLAYCASENEKEAISKFIPYNGTKSRTILGLNHVQFHEFIYTYSFDCNYNSITPNINQHNKPLIVPAYNEDKIKLPEFKHQSPSQYNTPNSFGQTSNSINQYNTPNSFSQTDKLPNFINQSPNPSNTFDQTSDFKTPTQYGNSFGQMSDFKTPSQYENSFGQTSEFKTPTQYGNSFGQTEKSPALSFQDTFKPFSFEKPISFGTQPIEKPMSFGTQPIEKPISFGTQPISFGTQPISFGTQPIEKPISFGTQPIEKPMSFTNFF
jgi:hypothetical protein